MLRQIRENWRSLKRYWYRRELSAVYALGEAVIGKRLDRVAHLWIGPRADGETDARYRKRLLDHLTMRWLHS